MLASRGIMAKPNANCYHRSEWGAEVDRAVDSSRVAGV